VRTPSGRTVRYRIAGAFSDDPNANSGAAADL
jgi:hypothetical protein